jgi:hypothetical protein
MRVNLAVGKLTSGAATSTLSLGCRTTRGPATHGASLLAGLSWVDLAVGKLGLLRALVGLSILAETGVFWGCALVSTPKKKRFKRKEEGVIMKRPTRRLVLIGHCCFLSN